jgi:hypothetical protein
MSSHNINTNKNNNIRSLSSVPPYPIFCFSTENSLLSMLSYRSDYDPTTTMSRATVHENNFDNNCHKNTILSSIHNDHCGDHGQLKDNFLLPVAQDDALLEEEETMDDTIDPLPLTPKLQHYIVSKNVVYSSDDGKERSLRTNRVTFK